MKIIFNDTGKRFNREWIFRHFTYEFSIDNTYAIIGPNGSGKSTLLQVLSGGMNLSEGQGNWFSKNFSIEPDCIYEHVSICAPYLELIEEMTLNEFLLFHSTFKPFIKSLTIEKIISLIGLQSAANKQLRLYSSGMKQRVKLAQAIFSDVPIVLLDEPCTNLDVEGIQLYHQLINENRKNRLLIISSNDIEEYNFCENRINISDYKTTTVDLQLIN